MDETERKQRDLLSKKKWLQNKKMNEPWVFHGYYAKARCRKCPCNLCDREDMNKPVKRKPSSVLAWGILTKRGLLLRWAIAWKIRAKGLCVNGEKVIRVRITEVKP